MGRSAKAGRPLGSGRPQASPAIRDRPRPNELRDREDRPAAVWPRARSLLAGTAPRRPVADGAVVALHDVLAAIRLLRRRDGARRRAAPGLSSDGDSRRAALPGGDGERRASELRVRRAGEAVLDDDRRLGGGGGAVRRASTVGDVRGERYSATRRAA